MVLRVFRRPLIKTPSFLISAVALLIGCARLSAPDLYLASDYESERKTLVHDVLALSVTDPKVLGALEETPRHLFVPPELRTQAYQNYPLEIGYGQTISQPLMVARMTEALAIKTGDKILEIGTGSGYQAAVLSRLASEVYTIEIVEELGQKTATLLQAMNFTNIHTKIGDGSLGWAEHAPYDAIIATAAPEHLPPQLLSQLKDGGRLVIPLGRKDQHLKVFIKNGDSLKEIDLGSVRFVPMTGEALRQPARISEK